MNARIPWWLKLSTKLVLARLPLGYSVWQRLGLFRHGCMDTSAYATEVFDAHMERAGMKGALRGKTILEIGPGDSISTAIVGATHGARAILVDSGAFVRSDVKIYIQLTEALARKGFQPPSLSSCRTIEEILDRCNAKYMTEGLQSLRQIDTHAVDLIFSQAVLEHVRKHDFLETMRECRRILRPGGVCSHRVDLRDHLGGELNNLRFSEWIWESKFFVTGGFYTNRISYGTMVRLFEQAGFNVDVLSVRRWDRLPTGKRKLAKQFASTSDEELCVSGFDVLLQ